MLPDDVQGLQERVDASKTFCAADFYFMHKLFLVFHRAAADTEQRGDMVLSAQALLRRCPDMEGNATLPIAHLTGTLAIGTGREEPVRLDALCEQLIRRDDLGPLKGEEAFQEAQVIVTKAIADGFPKPYKPWRPPIAQVEGPRSALVIPQIEVMKAQARLLRAMHWMNTGLFLQYFPPKVEALAKLNRETGPEVHAQIESIIQELRSSTSHVLHISRNGRQTEFPIPLIMDTAFSEAWSKGDGPSVEEFIANNNPAQCEVWIQERRDYVMRGLEAARFYLTILKGRDYPRKGVTNSRLVELDERPATMTTESSE